jgi:hypothetical protein
MLNDRPVMDAHQNFWQLTSIQVASMGVPGILLGSQVANQYGVGPAIGAICIGNLVLWLMGLVIISMSAMDRVDSIVNVRRRLGRVCAFSVALMLILAFLIWIVFQIKISVDIFDGMFRIETNHPGGQTVRVGAALGLMAALLAVGGIRAIKWINVICLPLLFIWQLYSLVMAGRDGIVGPFWGFLLEPIILIVLYNLVGTVTLPNFFRHSRSLPDSFLALTLMAFLNCFFQISSIWIGFNKFMNLLQHSGSIVLTVFVVMVVLLTLCNVVVNIYFASASWEAIVPRFEGPKEYAIIGLFGTAAYIFLQISPPMMVIVELTSDFVSNLALVLMLSYLVQLVVKYKPYTFGKWVGSASWVVGCVYATILKIQQPDALIHNLLTSMGACAIFFLSIIFIEETIWSIKTIFHKQQQ